MKKVVVIGSGISGLCISNMLMETYDVEIWEKSNKVGGLIKCDKINGILFHKVGGHVFNSRNEEVLAWFWKHFDRDNEFLKATRNAKILMDNNLIGYPIENYLFQLPENQIKPIIIELIELVAKEISREVVYENFKDFLVGNFGKHLYDLYFGPYNTKIWNTDLSKVPLEWLDGKLPMPQIMEVLLSNIIKKEESVMVHSTFYYPKVDGSQFIVDRLSKDLTTKTSYALKSVKVGLTCNLLLNDKFEIETLIYCGDIRRLYTIIDIPDIELKAALIDVSNLPSNGTSNVLCETDDNDMSWLYLPEEKFKAHRIIYTGNFSNSNNGTSLRKTCVVEFSGKHEKEVMIEELSKLPGNLKPIAFNYEPNSYIIQQQKTRANISLIKGLLSKYNIFLLGRFAEWEYYNMDKCIESAMILANELKIKL